MTRRRVKGFQPTKKQRRKGQGKGKIFERQILDSFSYENPFGFSQRIADKFSRGRRGKNFGAKTPADLLVCCDWGDILIECKATLGTSIALSEVRPHQFRALKKFHRVSEYHMGVVAVLFYNTERKKATRIYRAFLIDVGTWANLKKQYKQGTRRYKSINRAELFNGEIPCIEIFWKPPYWQIGVIEKKTDGTLSRQ